MMTGLLLTKEGEVSHQHAREVLRFCELLSRDWYVDAKHIFREENKATDYLVLVMAFVPSSCMILWVARK
ncbi:hypothetical protein LINPERPRIM_LOCUS24778 [Linum perenne]